MTELMTLSLLLLNRTRNKSTNFFKNSLFLTFLREKNIKNNSVLSNWKKQNKKKLRNHKLKKLNLNKMWKQTFFQDFSNFSKKWKIRRLHPPKLQQCQVHMNQRRLTSLVLGSDLRFTHQFWLLSASLSKHLGSLMKFRDKIDRFVAKSGLCHILRAQFTVSHLTKYSKLFTRAFFL